MSKRIGVSHTNYDGCSGEYWFNDNEDNFQFDDCVVEVSDEEYEFLKNAYDDWWNKARGILKKYHRRDK